MPDNLIEQVPLKSLYLTNLFYAKCSSVFNLSGSKLSGISRFSKNSYPLKGEIKGDELQYILSSIMNSEHISLSLNMQ